MEFAKGNPLIELSDWHVNLLWLCGLIILETGLLLILVAGQGVVAVNLVGCGKRKRAGCEPTRFAFGGISAARAEAAPPRPP
jgi:hypothetical protein